MPLLIETSAQRVFGSSMGMMSRAARDHAVSQVALQTAVPLATLSKVANRCVMSSSARRVARPTQAAIDEAGREPARGEDHEVGPMLATAPFAPNSEEHHGGNARGHARERSRNGNSISPKVSFAGAGRRADERRSNGPPVDAQTLYPALRVFPEFLMPARNRETVGFAPLGPNGNMVIPKRYSPTTGGDLVTQDGESSQAGLRRVPQAVFTPSNAYSPPSSVAGSRAAGLDPLPASRPMLASSQGVAVRRSALPQSLVGTSMAPRPSCMGGAQTHILARGNASGGAIGSRAGWSEFSPEVTSTDGAGSKLRDQTGGQPDAGTGFEGNILLDGALVGRWISRLLTRDAERASVGRTGFDIRRGRLLPGATVGGA